MPRKSFPLYPQKPGRPLYNVGNLFSHQLAVRLPARIRARRPAEAFVDDYIRMHVCA